MTLPAGGRAWPALTLGLTLALAGSGSAQNLEAYRTLAGQLDAAAAGAGQDALSTLKRLDAAQVALDSLKPTLSNAKTGAALQDTMNAVRAAQARTPVELRAQVQLARGLMRKALYDQTMKLLATSPANSAEHLTLLSRELGVDPAGTNANLKAGKLNVVAWQLQKSAAAKLGAALAGVQAQQSGASYLNLARAAGWFTVVQDTARSVDPPLTTEQFSGALAALAGGQLTELRGSLRSLKAGVAALNAALARPDSARAGSGTAPPVVTTPPVTKQPQPPAASSTPPAALAGVPGAAATYAGLGRALNAATQGNLPAARAELTRALAALAAAPASLRNTSGYDSLVRHITTLSQRQALRPADVQALMGELGALEARQAGQPQRAATTLATGSAFMLGGGLRAVLALLIALAAAAPLYLLNLAFGGKNPSWRAISAALVLLLLPALADGLFGFLGWLGDVLNMPLLRSLLFLTPGQSAFGVPLRLLTTALALGLATYGFRGLCIQFGLLGGPARPKGSARPTVTKPGQPDQTSLDWDEEF